MIIDYATSSLSLSQDDELDVKNHKKLNTIVQKAKRIKHLIIIKSIFFFIANFL